MQRSTNKKPFIFYYLIVLAVVIVLNILVTSIFGTKTQEVSYSEFVQMIENNQVAVVEVQEDQIAFALKSDTDSGRAVSQVFVTGKMEDPDLMQRLEDHGVDYTREIPTRPSWIMSLLSFFGPMIILVVLGTFLINRFSKKIGNGMGNAMSFGKSNAKVYVKATDGIKFKDVAGEDEAKEALTEIVDFLHNPGKYAEIGASMPKGALLVGPPGTGKTLLAKAVAGEADVPFFSISGSEFVEMFVGMGAAKVRDLFQQANEKAPCIVFIDEIDTIGKKRDGAGFTGNDEREQTLNQLLTEMDGFDGRKGVIILAATNRPESLDKALLRPGRFDRRIPVELPDLAGREAILRVHGKKVKLDSSVDFNAIARATAGASGALGYTMQVDEEEKSLMTKEEAFNKVATLTGGRAAEELIFGTFTTGASNDIEQATKIARAMVTRFGMSKNFDMMALETVNNPYLSADTSLTCSNESAGKVDEEVLSIIRSAHEKAMEILRGNMQKLNELSQYLLERETITGEEFMEILNRQ